MTDPLGAQGGAGDTGQSAGGATGTGEGQNANTGTGAQSGTGDGSTGQAPAAKTYSEAEVQALTARMQAADRRASEFEQQFKQLRDKDLPEMEKLKRDHAEATAKVESLTKLLNDARLHNAFLTDNTQEWHNPGAALTLLDRTKVQIDSEGNVTGMKDAITALAKDHAYLLKPKTGAEAGTGDGGGAGATPPGVPPANGGIGRTPASPSKEANAKRFPAMRSRMG